MYIRGGLFLSKATFSWKSIESKLGQKKKYPFIANSYVVSFGSVVTSFSKISGISLKTTEYMSMSEGGSDAPYILLDQSKNFNTITLERGLGIGFQGNTLTDMLAFVEKIKIRDMLLIIYGNTPNEKKAYYTNTAYVKDIVLSDLNAATQEVLIQSMTVVYDVFKESKDSSSSGKNNVFTTSNIGTISNQSQKKNNTTLQKTKENEDITKASLQNNNVNEKEKIALEEERKKEELEKQKRMQACFFC